MIKEQNQVGWCSEVTDRGVVDEARVEPEAEDGQEGSVGVFTPQDLRGWRVSDTRMPEKTLTLEAAFENGEGCTL